MVSCSTAPLPRMQCDTRHREMAAKVQGKHTVIYGSGICCQIRNRDLISSKSSSLFESRWGGVCSAQSCSALNLLLFLVSRSHFQSRHLSWPQHQEPQVGGREMRCPSNWMGGCFHCVIWSFPCAERGYGKIPKEDIEKGSERNISVQENHGLNGSGVGLEVHRFRLPSSAPPF